MYAVFKSGGKQHKVCVDDVLRVELLDAEQGAEINFSEVLLINNDGELRVGTPLLEGSSIKAEVLEHERGDKIHIIKMKRRKTYRRRTGHRQWYTRIKITGIN